MIVAPLAIAASLLLLGAPETPAKASAPSAKALEASAFTAVNDGRWCEANALFLQAHALGPAAELLANASLAAAYGGDRAQALSLLDTALTSAAPEKTADYKRRRAALLTDIKKKGPGTPCPPTTTTEMPTSPETPTTLPETPATPPETPETPTTTPETPPPPEGGGFPLWFGVAGGGAALGVAGAVTATVGALPWFAHDAARQALQRAQADKVDDDSLVDAQAAARADWEGYGAAAVVVGGVLVGVGVVGAVSGVVMGLNE